MAQCLVAAGYLLLFFTRYNAEKRRNDIEIGFIVSSKNKLNPKLFSIEVKSNKTYATKFLDRFGGQYRKRVGEDAQVRAYDKRTSSWGAWGAAKKVKIGK